MHVDGQLSHLVLYCATFILLFAIGTQNHRMEDDQVCTRGSVRSNPAPRRSPRTRFAPDSPQTTTAYPSDGGIVIGRFTAVELSYLNVSRFRTDYRSSDAAEEDKFAFDMMQLGAHWFSDWSTFWQHQKAIKSQHVLYDFHHPPTIQTAYPSTGGVWILKHSEDLVEWSQEDVPGWEPRLPREPDGLGKALSVCLNMDERALVLKNFGGEFFDHVGKCSDIPISLNVGVQTGQDYAILLRKMMDEHYLSRWLGYTDLTENVIAEHAQEGRYWDKRCQLM